MSDTTKPALPEPVPPNAEGSTTCIVRWMVTTRDGLWLGAWDKEAFAAYTQFAIDAAVAEARAVPDGRNVCKVNPGFRWDGDAQQHVPQVLVEFAPVPANALNDSPGWLARDAFVAALAATPSPAEQPKPAVSFQRRPARRTPTMNGAEKDTLVALVERGPLWDGDMPSKTGRDALLDKGLAVRVVVRGEDGWQAATYAGRDAYKALFPGPDGEAETMREARVNRLTRRAIKQAGARP